MSNVMHVVKELMQSEFDIDPETLSPDTTLESIGLDSLHAVALLLDLETRVQVTLTDVALTRNSRLGELVEVIESRLRSTIGAATG